MEIIMISESKIKVMLTCDDLRSFELEVCELDYANTETKRMFWDILSRAKHSVGFDTDGHRVLVQLYPSRCGGCEMFVTRLNCLSGEDREKKRAEIESVINSLPERKPLRSRLSGERHTGAFGFDRIEAMIRVCRELLRMGYDGESNAYIGENSRSYLFLSDIETIGYSIPDEFSFITEYGTCENADAALCYVGEHARQICSRHAVEQLARL